jgi:hypothetical protein
LTAGARDARQQLVPARRRRQAHRVALRREYVASFQRALRQSRLDVGCGCETIEYVVDRVAKASGNPPGKRSACGGASIQRIRSQLHENQGNEQRKSRRADDRAEENESTQSRLT